MTENPYEAPTGDQPQAGQAPPLGAPPPAYGAPPPAYGAQPPAYGAQPTTYAPPPASGPLGKIRPTGLGILLFIVTLGIYGWVWYYQTFEEMKRHKGDGLGGGMALVLLVISIFVGVTGLVLPFLSSAEVGEMYERRGQPKPVSGLTGLWVFPGIFILVGPIVWFVKTNGALNDYWSSLGQTR